MDCSENIPVLLDTIIIKTHTIKDLYKQTHLTRRLIIQKYCCKISNFTYYSYVNDTYNSANLFHISYQQDTLPSLENIL